MKCPICGCKMKKEIICPYCKITGNEVRFASNRDAKAKIKQKDTKEVYNSSYIPYDVDKKKLKLITVFGGFFGVDAYYLGRYKRAIIQSSIILLAFISFVLYKYIGFEFMGWPTEVLTLVCAVFLVMWFTNIINVLFFNKATVPVVLPNKEQLKNRIVEKEEHDNAVKEKKEAKVRAKFEKMAEREKKKNKKKEKENKNEE